MQKSEVMEQIELQTKTGGFVCSGWMPKFVDARPDVIHWGVRCFKYHGLTGMKDDKNRKPVYREVFAVALVDVD